MASIVLEMELHCFSKMNLQSLELRWIDLSFLFSKVCKHAYYLTWMDHILLTSATVILNWSVCQKDKLKHTFFLLFNQEEATSSKRPKPSSSAPSKAGGPSQQGTSSASAAVASSALPPPPTPVDPETQARLEALLEAAGIGKLTGETKQLTDPEVSVVI